MKLEKILQENFSKKNKLFHQNSIMISKEADILKKLQKQKNITSLELKKEF